MDNKRYVDLSERVTATYYDCEYEEWSEKTVTVEDVLNTTCDDYTVVEMPSAEPEKRTEERTETHTCDSINRQAALDAVAKLYAIHGSEGSWVDQKDALKALDGLPSAEPEVIHCKDCIYYDPEHVEKDGVRYEYDDMPKDAFDILVTGLVTSNYGINVGGRCCRDYNVGYPEDKRVFVSGQNYCGRAERKE